MYLPPSESGLPLFQKLGSGGKSGFVQGRIRLRDLEDTSKDDAPTPNVMQREMLPGMSKEWPWRWSVRLPASCSPEGKTLMRGTSLFQNPSPTQVCGAEPMCRTCPECNICPGSGGPVTDPFWISLIRYSSVWPARSGFIRCSSGTSRSRPFT